MRSHFQRYVPSLDEHLEILLDDTRPIADRRRALRFLENAPRDRRFNVARAIVVVLHGPPDIASDVHLALLALAPDLAIARDDDGKFVASTLPLAKAQQGELGRFDPELGRVVGLDDLARLFSPGEDLPAFLMRPGTSAPAPYRPAPNILMVREIERARKAERDKLRALGLDDDDLEDDAPPPHLEFVYRRTAPIFTYAYDGDAITLVIDNQRIDLGRAHEGAWWAEERAGDNRFARRWYVRLDRGAPSGSAIARRERAVPAPKKELVIEVGGARTTNAVAGRKFVVFIEEENERITGLVFTWTGAPVEKKKPKPRL